MGVSFGSVSNQAEPSQAGAWVNRSRLSCADAPGARACDRLTQVAGG